MLFRSKNFIKMKSKIKILLFAALISAATILQSNAQVNSWQTDGNTNAELPSSFAGFAGTVDSTPFILKACNHECARFYCNGDVKFYGTVTSGEILSSDLTVDGHIKTDADTTTAAPAKMEAYPDDPGHSMLLIKGNLNTLPALDVSTTYSGAYNTIGINATSAIQRGYGYAIYATGGKRGVTGVGSNLSFTGSTYGVFGSNGGTNGTRFGVYGAATAGTILYGVYGYAPSTAPNSYAGYFSGNLQYTGQLIGPPSERKLKRNIEPLTNVSDRLAQLAPVSFYYKTDEFPTMNFPAAKQLGLIADEVQALFPDLVVENFKPNFSTDSDDSNAGGIQYKALNYMGFVPVLIEAFREQKNEIATLKNQNNLLNERLTVLESKLSSNAASASSSVAVLQQNDPNPFNVSTTIKYALSARSEEHTV